MYTVTDLVEMGSARDVIRAELKDWFMFDDFEHLTFWVDDPWD